MENNIVRTDQYDVRSESLGDAKEPQVEEKYVYRGWCHYPREKTI